MKLLEEIFEWAKGLPPWIQDAVSRLAKKPEGLSEQDYRELCDECLADSSYEKPKSVEEKKSRHDESSSPKNVVLISVGHLKNVNKIDSGQVLSFAPSGMTIVYGDNGTGKSGYSRVFKHACFSRDRGETILPDISSKYEPTLLAEAVFTVSEQSVEKKIHWIDNGGTQNGALSSIAIFDSHIARIAVSEGQACHFIPYGLDIVQNLGNVVIPKIKSLVNEQQSAIDISVTQFEEFKGDDEIGTLFADLESSDIERIKQIAVFTESDIVRVKSLREIIDKTDTKAAIENIKIFVSRLKQLSDEFDRKAGLLSDEKVESWREVYDAAVSSKKAVELAQAIFRESGSYLPETGGAAWRQMFESAQSFARQIENNGRLSVLNRCVLCQQSLSEDAKGRMVEFEQFVRADASQRLMNAEKDLRNLISEIARLDQGDSLDAILISEISDRADDIANTAISFKDSFKKRHDDILKALRGTLDWKLISGRIESCSRELRKCAAKELCKAHMLKLVSDDKMREKLVAEQKVLERRYRLSRRIKEVEAWFDRVKRKKLLSEVNAELSPLQYTRKAKELFEKTVTKPLVAALEEEFQAIGVDRMLNSVAPITKGEKGRALYKLVLPHAKSIQIPQVLSEGEQKAIAIASFMAELRVGGLNNPIVLDDPVSSLDVWFRESIAKRLAKEAMNRQVIIFSHDPLFVCQLMEWCSQDNVQCETHYLENRGSFVGFPVKGLPWSLRSIESRIDELEKIQNRFKRMPWPSVPNESQRAEMMQAYDKLRAAIEQFVRDKCLGGVVKRFDDYVRVIQLPRVLSLDKTIIDSTIALYQKCHGVVSGHDHSTYGMNTLPTDRDLANDIEELKRLKNALKTNSAQCRNAQNGE